MNIGIISMQKVLNYGSFLQAFSLKKILEELGHNVYFIDIKPGRQIIKFEHKKYSFTSLIKKFDKYLIKRIENYLGLRNEDKYDEDLYSNE